MAKKKMTAQEIQAFDWTSLIAKIPALAAILGELLSLFQAKQATLKACPDCECPQAVKDLCDAECEAIANLILAHCPLHEAICGGDCDQQS